MSGLFARPRTLAEIRARAHAELSTNPTISVYEMLDGQEFNRHPANPWLPLRSSFDKLGRAFISVKVSMDGFAESLRAALANVGEVSE